MRARAEPVGLDPGSSYRFLDRTVDAFRLHYHHHGLMEINCLVRGRGTAHIGDAVQPWAAPCAYLTGPHLPHAWVSDLRAHGPHAALVLQFAPELAAPLAATPEGAPLATALQRAERGLLLEGTAARRVARLLAGFAAADGLDRHRRWLMALGEFVHAPGEGLASARAASLGTTAGGERLAAVARWLEQHATEDVALAAAARAAGMHPQALARFFRRHTGLTVVAWLQRLRVAHAAGLLRTTGDSVIACCYASGFRNLSHFNAVFRRLSGLTPTGYRQRFR